MRSIRRLFRREETYLLLVIIVIGVYLSIATNGLFLTPLNLRDLFLYNIYIANMAVGMLIVVISGGIDLSICAMATVAQYVLGTYLLSGNGNMVVAILLVMGVGFVMGSVNGFFIYRFNITPMIATIASMNVFYGLLQWASKGKWLYQFPQWFSVRGPLGVWFVVVLFVLVIAIVWFILNKTKMGRNIFAFGGNQEAAKRVGISRFKTQFFVYSFMGILAAVAGMGQLYLAQNYEPNALSGKELDILATVIIGGASLAGGKGTILGTLLGASLLAIIKNGLILTGVSSYNHSFVTGAVILVGLIFSNYVNNRQRSASGRGLKI